MKTVESEPKQVELDDEEATGGFTIVIPADEVVAAVREKHIYERDEYGVDVITIHPPFTGECNARHRFSRHAERWPEGMKPKPIDVTPSAFVATECNAVFPKWERVFESMRDDDVSMTEANAQKRYDDRVGVWEREIRDALCDEIGISRRGLSTSVPVRYE